MIHVPNPRPLFTQFVLNAGCLASSSQCCRLARLPSSSDVSAEKRFRELIGHARARVPFYSDRLPGDASSSSPLEYLASVPVTTKNDVEAHFPDQMTDGSDPRGWRMMSTRGTAQRLITVQDFEKRDAVRGAQLRMLTASGGYRLGLPMVEIPPEVCEVVCGEMGEAEEGVLSHSWEMLRSGKMGDSKSIRDLRGLIERHWIYNRKTYPGFGIHGSHPDTEILDQYIDRLQSDGPYMLKALATYLVAIGKRLLSRGDVDLQIPVIKTMGSRVTGKQRILLETAFRGKFWDDYGSAEFGSMACECEQHCGLHVFDDFFLIEVVDQSGRRVCDGEEGRVVVTDLMNRTMPLIRYEIGDIGRMTTEPCTCGLRSPRITVAGRKQDVLLDSSGDWKTHDDIVDFLESVDGVDAAQVTRKSHDRFEIVVVPESDETIDCDLVAHKFWDWFGRIGTVRCTTARTLRPEAGGKFRYVRGMTAID